MVLNYQLSKLIKTIKKDKPALLVEMNKDEKELVISLKNLIMRVIFTQ